MNRFLIIALLVTGAVTTRADKLAEQGRQVLQKNQEAVVTVRVVLKVTVSYGGQTSAKQDQKMETTGVVLDTNGLIATSYVTVDPTESLKSAYTQMVTGRGGRAEDLAFKTEVTDLKIVLADQSEIAGQIVLRDSDLDLAFIRPTEKPVKPFTPLDLTKDAKLQVLDEVVVLNRLNRTGNRAPAASLGRIEAILGKPRTFYVLGGTTWGYSLGAPVFTLDGRLVGLVLLRNSRTDVDTRQGFLFENLSKMGMMPIILPTEDIRDAAQQARDAKPVATEPSP